MIDRIARLATPDRVWFYAISIAVLRLVTYAFLIIATHQDATINDFIGFYTGTKFWLEGDAEGLYDFERQHAFQQAIADPAQLNEPSRFFNPPYAVFIYAAFSQWGYHTGLVLWMAFSLVALCVSITLLKHLLPGPWLGRDVLVLVLLFPATLSWFLFGQATAIIFCIWVATLALLRSDRDFLAGFVLGQLAFKPQLAIPLALPLIVTFRWRALLGGLLGVSLWIVLGLAVLRPQMLEYFALGEEILQAFHGPNYPREGVHSIFGFFLLLVEPISQHAADLLTMGVSLLGLGTLVYLWWGVRWEPDAPDWWTRWAITLGLGPLLSVQLFTYDLMLWVLPLAIVAGLIGRHKGQVLDGGPVLAWSVLLFLWMCVAMLVNRLLLSFLPSIGLPAIAVQLTPILIVGWCWAVWRRLGPRDKTVDATAAPASTTPADAAGRAEIA